MRTFECVLGSRSKKETPPAHGWDCNMITSTGYQCRLNDPPNNWAWAGSVGFKFSKLKNHCICKIKKNGTVNWTDLFMMIYNLFFYTNLITFRVMETTPADFESSFKIHLRQLYKNTFCLMLIHFSSKTMLQRLFPFSSKKLIHFSRSWSISL